MSFIKKLIDIEITNEETNNIYKDIESIFEKDTYSFKVEDDTYKLIIKEKSVIFNKENKESILDLLFEENKKNTGNYFIKDIDTNIDIKIETKKYIVKDSIINIEYKLWLQDEYTGIYSFKINIKE